MSREEELQMLKQAFEKGIVRIPLIGIITWSKANQIAKYLAGGLCTKEELVNAGLKAADGVDFWAYAMHKDGGADVIQLGTKPHARYISHRDSYGAAPWLEQINEQHHWRQLDHIFARRCEQKNITYRPMDFTKEDEIIADQKKDQVEAYKNARKLQISQNREKLSCEEEEQMLKSAFEQGVVRIATNDLLDWGKANEIANKFAGGLCSK